MRGLRRGIGLYIKEVSSPAYRREVQRLATKGNTHTRTYTHTLYHRCPLIYSFTHPLTRTLILIHPLSNTLSQITLYAYPLFHTFSTSFSIDPSRLSWQWWCRRLLFYPPSHFFRPRCNPLPLTPLHLLSLSPSLFTPPPSRQAGSGGVRRFSGVRCQHALPYLRVHGTGSPPCPGPIYYPLSRSLVTLHQPPLSHDALPYL